MSEDKMSEDKMSEDTAIEKLKKASETERLKKEEANRVVSERNKRMKDIENDINQELAKLELPIYLEAIDEIAFVRINDKPLFLYKKKLVKELYVVRYEIKTAGRIAKQVLIEQKVPTFMDFRESEGDEKALLLLKARIPGFIEYLTTKDERLRYQ